MTIGAKKPFKRIRWSIYGIDTTIPSLVMDINPAELSIAYKKLTNRRRTLGGFAEDQWGDDLDTLSSNGKTAMFYTNGLTIQNRRDSEAYGNFLKLIHIYQNNGTDFNSEPKIIKVGRVRMEYDDKTYDGYFESLSLDESPEEPFIMTYSFNFKILRTFGEYKVAKSTNISEFFTFI